MPDDRSVLVATLARAGTGFVVGVVPWAGVVRPTLGVPLLTSVDRSRRVLWWGIGTNLGVGYPAAERRQRRCQGKCCNLLSHEHPPDRPTATLSVSPAFTWVQCARQKTLPEFWVAKRLHTEIEHMTG